MVKILWIADRAKVHFVQSLILISGRLPSISIEGVNMVSGQELENPLRHMTDSPAALGFTKNEPFL